MSEEAANATKAVPYGKKSASPFPPDQKLMILEGILMSIGSCWLFGWIICIVIAACINPDLESVLGTAYGTPIAQIYYDAVGKKGALGLMSLVFIVQYFMGLSMLVAVSRQSWAFSRDGALPFSNFFKHVSTRLGNIPARAVWGCVFVALVLGLLCLIDPAAAAALFSLACAANNVAWGTPIFCRLVWGQSRFVPGPVYTGRFSKVIGWTAIVFLVFGIVLAMMPAGGPNPTAETMNYTVVVNCAVWGGSLGYYFLDARKWFTGPKMTLTGEEVEQQKAVTKGEEGVMGRNSGSDVGEAEKKV
jgi:amino acid transporter